MSKQLLMLASGCALLLPALADAADLPARRAPPVYVPPPAVFTWTGAYAGINAGYAFDAKDGSTLTGNDAVSQFLLGVGAAPSTVLTKTDGFTGGGQIGYNYQFGGPAVIGSSIFGGTGIVVGVEADAAYTDLHARGEYDADFGIFGLAQTNYAARTEFVGTVRGRLGYAIDRFMVYGTGGFAYGDVRSSVVGAFNGGLAYAGSQDKIKTGYAYGGGVEYALATDSFLNVFRSSAVTIKGEFIHYDLGSSSYGIVGAPGTLVAGSSFTNRVRTSGDLVRAGLNFKFGAPVAAPVVARY